MFLELVFVPSNLPAHTPARVERGASPRHFLARTPGNSCLFGVFFVCLFLV